MSQSPSERFAEVYEGTRDEHPLLEARHIDDLTEAVNALARLISKGALQFQQALDLQHRQLDMQRKQLDVLGEIRDALTSDERPTKRARKK